MLKKGLILQIMSWKDHLKPKEQEIYSLIKKEIVRKIMKEFILLRKKTYSYLIEDGKEDRKAQGTKKFAIKRKLKPKSYKTFLEATQAENKLNQLGKKLA